MTQKIRARIERHAGRVEALWEFVRVYGFVDGAGEVKLQTSTGTRFTAKAADSGGRKVIRFFQGGREYGRAYECCWGHYYNCNRTRIGMYCAALDRAAKTWFEREIAELRTELEKLPADRQEQLMRELEAEKEQ